MPRFSMDVRASFTATKTDPAAADPAVEGWVRDEEVGDGDVRELVFEREAVVVAEHSAAAREIALEAVVEPVIPGWSLSGFEAWVARGLTYELDDAPATAPSVGAVAAIHEVTLAGFDGGSDETDDLVVWVMGVRAEVEAAVAGTGATLHAEVGSATAEDVDFTLPADADRLSARIAEQDAAMAASPGIR